MVQHRICSTTTSMARNRLSPMIGGVGWFDFGVVCTSSCIILLVLNWLDRNRSIQSRHTVRRNFQLEEEQLNIDQLPISSLSPATRDRPASRASANSSSPQPNYFAGTPTSAARRERQVIAEFESRYGPDPKSPSASTLNPSSSPSITLSHTTLRTDRTSSLQVPPSTGRVRGHQRLSSSMQYSQAMQAAMDLLHSTESSLLASQSATKAEKDRMERELGSLERMLTAARSQYDSLQPNRLQADKLHHEEMSRLRSGEIARLEEQVQSLEYRRVTLEREVEDLSLSRTEKELELQQIQLDVDGFDSIRKECKELLSERATLIASNAALQDAAETLKRQHDTLADEHRRMSADLAHFESAHGKLGTLIHSSDVTRSSLQERELELMKAEEKLSLKERELETLQAELLAKQSQLDLGEEQLREFEARLNQKEKQLEILEATATKLEATLRERAEQEALESSAAAVPGESPTDQVAWEKSEAARVEATALIEAAKKGAAMILSEAQRKSTTMLESAAAHIAKAETSMQQLMNSAEEAAKRDAAGVLEAAKQRSQDMLSEAATQIELAEKQIHKLLSTAEQRATSIIQQAEANKEAKEQAIKHLLNEADKLAQKTLRESEQEIQMKESQCRELIEAVTAKAEQSILESDQRKQDLQLVVDAKEAELRDLENTIAQLAAQAQELNQQIQTKQIQLQSSTRVESPNTVARISPSLPTVASPSQIRVSAPVASNSRPTTTRIPSTNMRLMDRAPELTTLTTFGDDSHPGAPSSPSHVDVVRPPLSIDEEYQSADDHSDDEPSSSSNMNPSTPSRYTFRDAQEQEENEEEEEE